jgi:hypothetical protein
MPSVFVSHPDLDMKPPYAASMVQSMNNGCTLPSKGREPLVEEINIRQNAAAVIARTLNAWLMQDNPTGTKTSWRDQVKDQESAISVASSLLSALRGGHRPVPKTKAPA